MMSDLLHGMMFQSKNPQLLLKSSSLLEYRPSIISEDKPVDIIKAYKALTPYKVYFKVNTK